MKTKYKGLFYRYLTDDDKRENRKTWFMQWGGPEIEVEVNDDECAFCECEDEMSNDLI